MGLIDRFTKPIKEEFESKLSEKDSEIKALSTKLDATENKLDLVAKEFDFTVLKTGYGEPPPMYAQEYWKKYEDWVYTNVNVIAEAVADIQFELYKISKGEKVDEIKEHPILELIYRVNSFQTKWEFIYMITTYLLLQGECPVYLAGKTNANSVPSEMWILRPDFLRIIPGDVEKDEYVYAYKYEVPGKDAMTFAPWEILFLRIPNPTNAYRGMGVIEAAKDTIMVNEFSTRWNRNFFYNSARPDAVLMTDQSLDKDILTRLQQKWYEKFGRVDNSQRVAVLEAGLKYQQIQMSAKDMDFLEGQRWTRDKIMAMFRNTKMSLGIVDDVNRANAEASEYMHIKSTIKPKMQRICDFLNEFLVPLFGKDLFLGFEDPLPESEELKFKKWEIGLNRVYTINELREEEGLDPVDGGDVIYMPMSQVPLGSKTPQIAPEKTFKVLKGTGKALNKKYKEVIAKINNRDLRLKKFRQEVEKKVKEMARDLIKRKYEYTDKITDDVAEKFHAENNEHLARIEPKTIDKILKVLKSMEKDATSRKKKFEFKGDYEKDVSAVLGVSEAELIALVGKEALELLQRDQQFISGTDIIQDFITETTLKAAKTFTETVRTKVAEIIADGASKGQSYDKISKNIRSWFSEFSKYDAQRIVRTELARSIGFAQVEAYKQSGVVYGKRWFTALDERVCPYCRAMQGKIVDLNDNYFNLGDEFKGEAKSSIKFDYLAVEAPPLHPQCRCDALPVTEDTKKVEPDKKMELLEKKLDEILKDEDITT